MHNLGVEMIKIGSAEVTRLDLLEEVASYGLPAFLSTGMSTLEEIDRAVEILRKTNLTIMHATSSYPCALEDLHLRVIHTLAEARTGCRSGSPVTMPAWAASTRPPWRSAPRRWSGTLPWTAR